MNKCNKKNTVACNVMYVAEKIARILRQASMKGARDNVHLTNTDRKQGGPSSKFATLAITHFREKNTKGNTIHI